MAKEVEQEYVLGIDLGSASLGWAAIELQDGEPFKVLRTGVRIFEPAVCGNIESGQDESNAVARRSARLIRRNFRRRAARQRDLFRLLQGKGLLPQYKGPEADASEQRHAILNLLDREISDKWSRMNDRDARKAIDLPLYLLRNCALDMPLEPFEVGRIFYHLGQRRGYRSNRKKKVGTEGKPTNKKDDPGKVEADIKCLDDEIRCAGARTLGEYFASLDPHKQKVRRRWTARKMYEDEFALIWEKQASYRPNLFTKEVRRDINQLLFYQRPTRRQPQLIGKCELEAGERRAAWATLEAQRFRVLQKVNDLELIYPGQATGVRLSVAQREELLHFLNHCAQATFEEIRKALGLPNNVRFNLQRGGETRLKGNVTNAHMVEVFGDRWPAMSEEDRKQVVEDWRTIEREGSLIRRATEHWKLDQVAAECLARRLPPAGYCSLSRKAIRRLLDLMYAGKRFKEAENEIYGNRASGGRVHDRIPPVREALKDLRNPAIERALTELRKVANALVGQYGKPAQVRIELARDLKKPKRERAQAARIMRSRERERNAAKAKLLEECGIRNPSRDDIEKALLWQECGGECPYTGKRFPFWSLFCECPSMQVEHIIPFSRIPDDSFQNKTLCALQENQYKANRTPFEAYGGTNHYGEILNRLRNWKRHSYGESMARTDKLKAEADSALANPGKLRRFELRTTEELEAFKGRQLNDTRYASKLACDLIGTLYGGRDVQTESGDRQVVFASSGMVTAKLRHLWGLNSILREPCPSPNGVNTCKSRADHRHHAIDAITIALSQPKLILALNSGNAKHHRRRDDRSAPSLQAPWKDFVASVRPHIEQLLVSHRPEHRLSGALHDETNYSCQRKDGTRKVVHIRKPVSGLSATDIENIVDPAVRDAVRAKATVNGGDLKNWALDEAKQDWPTLAAKSGKRTPIKRVRVKKSLTVETIGSGPRTRNVALSSKHHCAIYSLVDHAGREKRWACEVVSLFEAMNRKQHGKPVVQSTSDAIPNAIFKFHLMWGDVLLVHKDCNHTNDICVPSFWRVRCIWEQGELTLARISDARSVREMRGTGDLLYAAVNTLRKLSAVKVSIDTLGRCHTIGS